MDADKGMIERDGSVLVDEDIHGVCISPPHPAGEVSRTAQVRTGHPVIFQNVLKRTAITLVREQPATGVSPWESFPFLWNAANIGSCHPGGDLW